MIILTLSGCQTLPHKEGNHKSKVTLFFLRNVLFFLLYAQTVVPTVHVTVSLNVVT